jgi:hypothetical protein
MSCHVMSCYSSSGPFCDKINTFKLGLRVEGIRCVDNYGTPYNAGVLRT